MAEPHEEGVVEAPSGTNLETSDAEHLATIETESSNISGDSDNESYESSSQNGDLQTETRRREKLERARIKARDNLEKDRIKQEAFESFHSHAGIIYVADELWMRLRRFSAPCHLYVALHSLDMVPPQQTPSSELPGFLPDLGPPKSQNLSPGLPPRFQITNGFLRDDMDSVRRDVDLSYPYLYYHHIAPFREIIPFEQKFRQRLLELEEAFNEMALTHPEHTAVLRQESDWVPEFVIISGSIESLVPVGLVDWPDEVVKTRLLRDGYRALVHLLDNELGRLVQDHRQIQDKSIKQLPFVHLWHLFKPGQEIVTHDVKFQVYRILNVTGGRKLMEGSHGVSTTKSTLSNLTIDCFYLDFDGQEFGPVPFVIIIKPYDGLKEIKQLIAYPLDLCVEPYSSQNLIERGIKYHDMVEASHRKYKGPTLKGEEPFDTIEEIDGDVMVDSSLAYRSNEPTRKISAPEFYGGVIDDPTIERAQESFSDDIHFEDPAVQRSQWRQWLQESDLLETHSADTMNDEHYKLLPAKVWGYVFLRRKWYPLDIDLIQQIHSDGVGSADGFDKLVLPSGHKDIVRALVQTHAKRSAGVSTKSAISPQREFDLVKGKGKGLIILLHGAPGVGKTSTAECVAANAGKPLFPITIGDVGAHSAAQVEQNLEKYFDLARKWNCVLLLDEADVFLGTRVEGNIIQNSLVSVFLRALEYYSGILILTTNRVGSFDEAIKSRVHCALYYPPLGKKQTMDVWKMNIQSLEERNREAASEHRIQFNSKEIKKFARQHWSDGEETGSRWNGRQIKNAFQTAVALADYDTLTCTSDKGKPNGTVLERAHFEKVAEASEHFDMYLERTRTSDQQRAREHMLREDNVGSRYNDRAGSDEESTSEEEVKKKKKGAKKTSTKKSKNSKDKRSKSKKQRKEESDEESTDESESEESTS